MQHSTSGFQTTMWSMVMQAQSNREQLERLLRIYWRPIYTLIRTRGISGHDASDLTQEFMLKVVLGRDLIARADPSRGRFRTFLRAALANFLIDQHRAGRIRSRSIQLLDSANCEPGARRPDAAREAIVAEFDRRWAAALVEQTLDRLREHCELNKMHDHWAAFDACVLAPSLRKQDAPTLEVMARRLTPGGPYTPDQVSNMIHTLRRAFRRMLREAVADTVASPADVEPELADLRAALGHGA